MKIVGTQLHNRRRDNRVSVMPIQIELKGHSYTTTDWSLGGFLIDGYSGRLSAGDEVMVAIQVIADGVEFSHVARAEVIRNDSRSGQLAANFLQLDSATIATLEGWLTGRLRRKVQRDKAD